MDFYILSIPTVSCDIRNWEYLFYAEKHCIYKRVKTNYTIKNVDYHVSFNLNLSSVECLEQLQTHSITEIHMHCEIYVWEFYHCKPMHDMVLCFLIFSKFMWGDDAPS